MSTATVEAISSLIGSAGVTIVAVLHAFYSARGNVTKSASTNATGGNSSANSNN